MHLHERYVHGANKEKEESKVGAAARASKAGSWEDREHEIGGACKATYIA